MKGDWNPMTVVVSDSPPYFYVKENYLLFSLNHYFLYIWVCHMLSSWACVLDIEKGDGNVQFYTISFSWTDEIYENK